MIYFIFIYYCGAVFTFGLTFKPSESGVERTIAVVGALFWPLLLPFFLGCILNRGTGGGRR